MRQHIHGSVGQPGPLRFTQETCLGRPCQDITVTEIVSLRFRFVGLLALYAFPFRESVPFFS